MAEDTTVNTEELSSTIASLTASLKKLSEDAGKVNLKGASDSATKTSSSLKELSSTANTIKSALKQFGDEVATATKQLDATKQSLQEQSTQASRLKRSMGAASNEFLNVIQTTKAEYAVAKAKVSVAQASVAQARELLNAQKQHTAALLKEADSTFATLEQKVQEQGGVQALIDSRNESLGYVQAQIKAAQGEKQATEERISQIKSANQALQSQAESSRDLERFMQSQINAANEDVAASNDRIKSLRGNEEVQKSQIDAVNEEIRRIQKRGEFKGRGKQKELTQEEEQLVKTLQARKESILAAFNETKEMRKAEIQYRDSIAASIPGMEADMQSAADAAGAYESAIAQNNNTLTRENLRRLDLIQSIGGMESEAQQISEGLQELEAINNDYQSEIDNLTDKLQQQAGEVLQSTAAENNLQKALEDRIAEEETVRKEAANTLASGIAKSMNALAGTLQTLGNALGNLVATVRQTQQQFGLSAGSAAKLKFENLVASVKSFAGTFTSLGKQAGVTTEQIQEAQAAFQSEFGGVLTSGAAADIARQAKEMGVGAGELAKARRVFMTQTMGDTGAAKKAQDQFVSEFAKKGLTSKDAMAAIGQNSELLARNGTRFAVSFARAAADAKKIGVDLGKIDQVGDNIIGDFEGFLEKQAELGAMGFGFDSSRLAEVAESGDTGALMEELRSQLASQGKDLTKLRRSEQLALSQAFGISMEELQRLGAPKGTEGSGEATLSPEQLQKDANGFLSRLVNLGEAQALVFTGIATTLGFIAKGLGTSTAQNIISKFIKLPGTGAAGTAATSAAGTAATSAAGTAATQTTFLQGLRTAITSPLQSIRTAIAAPGRVTGSIMQGAGSVAKSLISPVSKGVKLGGSALSGIFGAAEGFMTARQQGKSGTEAAGSGLVQGGLAAVGTALGAMGGPLGMMVGGFIGNTLGKSINKYFPGVAHVFGQQISGFISMFTPIKEAFGMVWKSLSPVKDAFMSMFAVFSGPGGETSETAKKLGKAFEVVGSVIGMIVLRPLQLLAVVLRVFSGGLEITFRGLAVITKLLSGDFSGAKEAVGKLWDSVKSLFSDIGKMMVDFFFGPIKKFFPDFWALVTEKFNSVVDWFASLPEKITAGLSSIGDWFTSLPEKISTAFDTAVTWFTSLPEMIWNGITGAFTRIFDWIKEKISSLNPVNAVRSVASKLNPMNWFGDDVVSRSGYGERTLVTPSGAIALNNRDNVVAYADDMVSDAVNTGVRFLSFGALGRDANKQKTETTPSVSVDLTKLEAKLDQVVNAIGRMNVEVDGQKIGKILVGRTDASTTVGLMRRG